MDIQKSFFAAALVAATLIPNASAGTNGFYAPYFRGVAGTEVAGWDRFSSGYNVANQPDMSGFNTGSRATLTQLDPVGAVLGSGNIYVGVGGTANFNLRYASLQPIAQISFQIRTLGTEIDYSGLRLNYVSQSKSVSLGGTPTTLAIPLPKVFRVTTFRWLTPGTSPIRGSTTSPSILSPRANT